MKYQLIHQDAAGNINKSCNQISFLTFVKHATFAGINTPFFPLLPFRYLSNFWEFAPSFFQPNGFRLIPELANDPTETAYISNRIGRAFADYFSKEVYEAKFTHSYECAMALKGYPISGKRPDFYCVAPTKQFAVEAKGFSRSDLSGACMQKYKNQSQTGPLQVHFSVASVSYNLYQSPKIKFYDPISDNTEYDFVLNSRLRDLYYSSVLEFIEAISDLSNEQELPDYKTYIIRYPFAPMRKILIHRAIFEKNWNSNDWLESLKRHDEESEELYIDVDGIGLAK